MECSTKGYLPCSLMTAVLPYKENPDLPEGFGSSVWWSSLNVSLAEVYFLYEDNCFVVSLYKQYICCTF